MSRVTRACARVSVSSATSPVATASTIASMAACWSRSVWHTRNRSTPACRPCTTAAATSRPPSVTAPISMSSATITPSNPSSPRRSRTTGGLSEAGRPRPPGSSAGTATWATSTAATPARTAAANGTSSTARSRSGPWGTVGSARWLSTAVSPCPGKCLPQAATPSACRAATKAAPIRATRGASSLKARAPMTGLAGFVSTSSTGARSTSMFTARSSRPMTRPAAAAARSGSAAAPSARAAGTAVNGGPSRATRPPSWSTSVSRPPGGAPGRPAAASFRLAHSRATCSGPATLRPKRMAPPAPRAMSARAAAGASSPAPSNPNTTSRAASRSSRSRLGRAAARLAAWRYFRLAHWSASAPMPRPPPSPHGGRDGPAPRGGGQLPHAGSCCMAVVSLSFCGDTATCYGSTYSYSDTTCKRYGGIEGQRQPPWRCQPPSGGLGCPR